MIRIILKYIKHSYYKQDHKYTSKWKHLKNVRTHQNFNFKPEQMSYKARFDPWFCDKLYLNYLDEQTDG